MTFTTQYARTTFGRTAPRKKSDWREKAVEEVNTPAIQTQSFTAPVGGLMLFDEVSSIPEGGALVLDNWVCLAGSVRVRGGSEARNTGMGGSVVSIGVYEAGTTSKAFAIGGPGPHTLREVTSVGAVPAALVSGLQATNWTFYPFTTSGGTFLFANGYGNAPLIYDGTTWATVTMTGGPTATKLGHVWAHGSRVFMAEQQSLNAWYLPLDSIGGALTKFSLGGVFALGGSLVCGATWTSDAGGSGLQSSCVFMSSKGEVAVYDGPNPASWTLRGVYRVSPPCGQNCFMKSGGDLAVMTEDGLIAMSQAESLDRAALANESVSKNILPLWREAVKEGSLAAWQIVRRDAEGMAIVSIPATTSAVARQFIANLQTGAWSRWTGLRATCFAVFGGELLFGTTDGRILRADTTGADTGASYTAAYVGPFRVSGGQVCTGKVSRAVISSVEAFVPKVVLKFDYDINLPAAPQAVPDTVGAQWDAAQWDAAQWSGAIKTRKVWQATPGSGSAYAPCVMFTLGQTTTPNIRLLRTDIGIETGEVVT